MGDGSLVVVVYQTEDDADWCPKAVHKLLSAIQVGAPKSAGRVTRHAVYDDERDIGTLVASVQRVLNLNPSIRVVLLAMGSVHDPVTRRQMDVVKEMAPILAKDKSIRVATCDKPYRCISRDAPDEIYAPPEMVDTVYGTPELTLGVTGPVQRIICEKIVPWLDAPVVIRKKGTQKLTDMPIFTLNSHGCVRGL